MRPLNFDDFLRLLETHQPVTIKEEHIKQAEEETNKGVELISVPLYYPSIKTIFTSGYKLPSDILPFRFRGRLLHEATDTAIYSEAHGVIDEMIFNAILNGNKNNKTKSVYILWHRCQKGKEIYIVDEGDILFNPINPHYPGKPGDLTGIDCLEGYCRRYKTEYEYFSIVRLENADSKPTKKGTFLRILLERNKQPLEMRVEEGCNYLGHKLFARPT